MRYQLNYFSLEANEPETVQANSKDELFEVIETYAGEGNTPFTEREPGQVVFLCCIERSMFVSQKLPAEKITTLVFCADEPQEIMLFIAGKFGTGQSINVFLQEYHSYEEAYGVALGMMEPNKLCYSDEAGEVQ